MPMRLPQMPSFPRQKSAPPNQSPGGCGVLWILRACAFRSARQTADVRSAMPVSRQKLRIGVLASGEGTTLQAILDATAKRLLNADVVLVISNNHDCGALRRAKAASVAAVHLSAKTHPDADALDRAMLGHLEESKVDVAVLAGFMKKVGPRTLATFGERMLNTHPSLLPKYGGKGMYGHRVHEAVLAAGESETGVTVH